MRLEHVIHLTAGRCSLHSWNRDRFAMVGHWDLAGSNLTPLLDHLQVGAPGPIGILADLVEEEHTRDRVARLNRRDQQAMVARRLVRAFPRTEYRTALLQGRDDSDPPGQRVLFCALTNPDCLAPLLAELNRLRLPVALVTSPALSYGPILRKLRPGLGAQAATMLVSRHTGGSLRLSFLRGTELVGSRLLRSGAAPPGDPERLLRQLEESVRYFEPAFVPSAGNPVEVLLLAEPGLDPAASRAPTLGSDAWHLRVPPMEPLAAGLGIRAGIPAGQADHLYIELLRRHQPAASFAGAADLRYFRLHRMRSLGRAACLAVGATGVVAASLNTLGIVEAHTALNDTRTALAGVSVALQSAAQSATDTGADPMEMQRTVAAWEALRQHRIEPQLLLAAVSRAVAAQPRIQLDAIQWSPMVSGVSAENGAEAEADAPDTEAAEPPVTDGEGEAAADESAADTPQRVRITLKGRIEPFDSNYPLAFAELQAFMERLRANSRVVSVVARKQPLDVSPRGTLSGELSRERREEEAAFAVDVVMRWKDEPA